MNKKSNLTITISQDNSGERIDKIILKMHPEYSRNRIQKSFEAGLITKDGNPIKKNYIPKPLEVINLSIKKADDLKAIPQNIPINIIYEDEDLIVVNKDKGMVVHPAPGNLDGTLVNALLYHCDKLSNVGSEIRPGIVHRIDKDTSGLLVVAKNDFSHNSLASQIEKHKFERKYIAIVKGVLKEDTREINLPIGRCEQDRKKMSVTLKNSKHAITTYEVIKRYKDFTYLSLALKTGRTHQIRVHMAYLGHPIVGDTLYGRNKGYEFLKGQCLHAKTIEFKHPKTQKILKFDSNIPNYFEDFLKSLNS